MPTQQNIWNADWQPYDTDEDPFKADWEPTDRAGTENPWQAEWQEEVEEAPTFGGRVKESWETGKKQVSIGQIGLKQILGDKTPETEARAQAIEETIPTGPRPSRSLPEQAVRAAAEMAPIPLTGMEQGLRRGTALGLGFGAIATLGGPAAPVTVPAAAIAGFSIGMISASLENIGGIEAGLAYREFKDLKDPDTGEKMNENIAKVAGIGVGVINGAIELLQIKTFLRSIPGAESLVRKGLTASVKRVLQSKALKSIVFRAAKKYGAGVAIETGQEELQEIVNISGRYMATEVNNAFKGTNIPTQTRQEIVDQLLETGKQSLLAFSVFMLPGSAVSSTQDMAERRKEAGPGEADLLATDKKTKNQEAELREAYNTGQINSGDLKEMQAQLPKKHPIHKVIGKILKESEATTPETDILTGDVIALEPEDFIPDAAIPEPQMFEAAPPQGEAALQPLHPLGASAEESAQVFEGAGLYQDKARADQLEIERRAEVERAAKETSDRTTLAGYEGLTQQVKEKGEKSEIEGMEFKVPYIRGFLEQVKGAEAGKRIRVTDYDGTEKWFGVPSEFPSFMKNRYSKKEVVSAIEKGLSGYVFPEHEVKQASIWEDVKSEAYEMRNRDLRLAAETYIEEPTTIEGLPDKDYKLLITELQHEGISTREIEEVAARHRKTIESDVIASIANEYGFSKEEIEQILSDPFEAASDRDAAWKEATGTKPVAAYLTPITEGEEYDREKKERIPRIEREREKPGRAIQQERGGKEAAPSGILQEASPDEIEQKGQLIAKLINGNLFPGHKVKYDGIWPGFAPDMPDMYQFTAYAGPAKGATFISKELEADSVKEKLEDTVEKFSKAPPVKEPKQVEQKVKEEHEIKTSVIDGQKIEVDVEPSDAQIEKGNYKKGHINLYGLDITIENPKGSVRKGINKDGKAWEIVMKHHYGYILRTEDKDGDQVDVFVGEELTSEKVFVVNQMVPATTQFDEHKTMMGFETVEQARVAYLANYESGWQGLGNIVSLSIDEFKAWLKEADQTKPISKATIKGHKLPFMTEHKTKADLDKIYQDQVKELTERAGPDKGKRAEMLAEVISAYKIESKKYPEVTRETKEPTEKPAKEPTESLKEVFESPSATEAEVIREKAKLKAQLIEGVKSGKFTGAVRFGTVVELKVAIEKGKLPVSKEYGAIHAQPIMGKDDDTFAAYGAYDKHNMAYIVPTKHLQEKIDAHTKEVLVDPATPLDALTFLIDGHEKAYSYDELEAVLGEKEAPKVEAAAKEPLVLTPEQGTPWERQAELEKEGVVERPAKDKKVKAKFGETGITGAGIAGRQQGLFGVEKGETSDMFAEAEAKERVVKELIAEIESHIMPNDNLSRGLDYYASKYENFTTDQLKELREWTKTQNPYINNRLGGNIQTEILFREEKAKAPVETADDVRKKIFINTAAIDKLQAKKDRLKKEALKHFPKSKRRVDLTAQGQPIIAQLKDLRTELTVFQAQLKGLEKKEAKVFVNTLDQVRADAKAGKKAGIEYVAQREVSETGDIIDVPMDAGTALNEADNRLENYNKLLECIESD